MSNSKKKQQKKKDRERRVAQKKLTEAQKRAHEQTARENDGAAAKLNKLASAVPVQKTDYVAAKSKATFIRRRSMG